MRRKFLWTVAVVFGILLAGPGWSGADTPESILNLNHSRNSADSPNLPRIPIRPMRRRPWRPTADWSTVPVTQPGPSVIGSSRRSISTTIRP